MILLTHTLQTGLIFSFLAIGVYISYRIYDFPDVTTDSSFTLGSVVVAVLLHEGWNPILASAFSFLAGCCAGGVTGFIHARWKINKLLAGILTMTALYSINLRLMGSVYLSFDEATSILTYGAHLAGILFPGQEYLNIFGLHFFTEDLVILLSTILVVALCVWFLYVFFQTQLGLAMRATGENPTMARTLGIKDGRMVILGIAFANGMCAVSGAHFAQELGRTDIQLGIGMIVTGLASMLLGEAIVGRKKFGWSITSAVLGSLLYRLLYTGALQIGFVDGDLKFLTAIFVLTALLLPGMLRKFRTVQPVK